MSRSYDLKWTNLKESIARTVGAFGIFMYKEFAKNVMRRRASKFIGTFIADSLTVRSKWSLTTYEKQKKKKNWRTPVMKILLASTMIVYEYIPSLSRFDSLQGEYLSFQTSAFYHVHYVCQFDETFQEFCNEG